MDAVEYTLPRENGERDGCVYPRAFCAGRRSELARYSLLAGPQELTLMLPEHIRAAILRTRFLSRYPFQAGLRWTGQFSRPIRLYKMLSNEKADILQATEANLSRPDF